MNEGYGETGAGAPRCPYTDCEHYPDCLIISLLKKAPKKGQKCSYYKRIKGRKKKGSRDG